MFDQVSRAVTEISEPKDEVDLGNECGWRDTSLKAPHAVSLLHDGVSHTSTTGLAPSCPGTANSSSLNPIKNNLLFLIK